MATGLVRPRPFIAGSVLIEDYYGEDRSAKEIKAQLESHRAFLQELDERFPLPDIKSDRKVQRPLEEVPLL